MKIWILIKPWNEKNAEVEVFTSRDQAKKALSEAHFLAWRLEEHEIQDARSKQELIALAMLASDKPEFDNPLVVYEVKKLRDRILAERDHSTATAEH